MFLSDDERKQMKRYESTMFSHDAVKKVFTAESSELAACGEFLFSAGPAGIPTHGFTMVSSKTGDTADFLVEYVHRNVDRDIDYWRLTPTSATVKQHPELKNYVVQVFND
jgi:hypothetical protein